MPRRASGYADSVPSPALVRAVGGPRVDEAIHGPHPFVALVGARGTGKSTLLRRGVEELTAQGLLVRWFDGTHLPADADVLVLDDAHVLEPRSWQLLVQARRSRPHLRVRLATTTAAALPPDCEAEVVELGELDEAAVVRVLAEHDSPADPRLVTWLSGGHPASVGRIAERRAATVEQVRAALAEPGPWPVLPPDLEHLAVPAHLSHSLVTALNSDAETLEHLEREGVGRWTGPPGHTLFVLTPLVRESTLARSRATNGRRLDELHLTAARTHLADGHGFATLVEAMALGRLDLADQAVKLGGLPLLANHGFAVVTLLRPVPVRHLSSHPVLAFALALCLNAHRHSRLRALELLTTAVVGARLPGRRPQGDRALMRVVESVALRVSGAGDSGLAAARSASRTLEGLTPEGRRELGSLEPDLHAHVAITLLHAGQEDRAVEHFEWATGGAPRPGIALLGLGGVAAAEALRGDVRRAREWIAVAEARRWPRDVHGGYAGCLLHVARAQLAVERLDLDEAYAALDLMGPHLETIEHWPLLGHVRALADLVGGRAAHGLEEFRALRRRRTGRFGISDWARRRLDATEALLLLGTGDSGSARALLSSSSRDTGALLARARVALVTGELDHAVTMLGRATPTRPSERMTAAALRSVVLRRQGRVDERRQALEEVAAIHDGYDLRTPLMFLPHGELDHLRADLLSVSDALPQALAPGATTPQLTPRELVVLRELVRTSDVREIAEALHVSVNTVKSQRRSLYRKLAVSSREDAVTAGLVYGLLEG